MFTSNCLSTKFLWHKCWHAIKKLTTYSSFTSNHNSPTMPVFAVRISLSIWYFNFRSIGLIFSNTYIPAHKTEYLKPRYALYSSEVKTFCAKQVYINAFNTVLSTGISLLDSVTILNGDDECRVLSTIQPIGTQSLKPKLFGNGLAWHNRKTLSMAVPWQ